MATGSNILLTNLSQICGVPKANPVNITSVCFSIPTGYYPCEVRDCSTNTVKSVSQSLTPPFRLLADPAKPGAALQTPS